MTKGARILVVDDEAPWRKLMTEAPSRHGIIADAAATVAEAYSFLEERCYHLLVLDIQMVEGDPENKEGLQLLRELHERGLDKVFKVIMLSAKGDMDRMRKAFAEYHVADFQEKRSFDNLEYLKTVQRLLSELDFRPDLAIHWQPVDAPQEVVSGLALGTALVANEDTALVSRATIELEDLLCRLFHDATSLIVQPLAPGFSGAKVLWVQPFYKNGGARPVIVKFGEHAKIEQEHQNFDTYVKPFFGGRSTTILERRRTVHLGGIVYSLLDATDDRVRDFGQFYRDATSMQVRRVLENLLFDTCRDWYGNLDLLAPCDLTEEYQRSLNFSWDWLARMAEQLNGVKITSSALTFHSLAADRTFSNPFATMANQRLIRPTYRCITHGDPNQRNIFVDNTGRAWLIDFARTGPSHFLRDIVLLDSVVRFELLAADEATLEERLHLEELLLATEGQNERQRLKAGATLLNPHVAKAFVVTIHLRRLAKQLGPKNLRYGRSGYTEGILYTAMNAIKFHQMPMVQREHALLCAGLMADHLKS